MKKLTLLLPQLFSLPTGTTQVSIPVDIKGGIEFIDSLKGRFATKNFGEHGCHCAKFGEADYVRILGGARVRAVIATNIIPGKNKFYGPK